MEWKFCHLLNDMAPEDLPDKIIKIYSDGSGVTLLKVGRLTQSPFPENIGERRWFNGEWEEYAKLGELNGNDMYIVPPENMPVMFSPFPPVENN